MSQGIFCLSLFWGEVSSALSSDISISLSYLPANYFALANQLDSYWYLIVAISGREIKDREVSWVTLHVRCALRFTFRLKDSFKHEIISLLTYDLALPYFILMWLFWIFISDKDKLR